MRHAIFTREVILSFSTAILASLVLFGMSGEAMFSRLTDMQMDSHYGADPDNKAFARYYCHNVNLGPGEVGADGCKDFADVGKDCIACADGIQPESYRTSIIAEGHAYSTAGMTSCTHLNKYIGQCAVNPQGGFGCMIAALPQGECGGEINQMFSQPTP